MHPSLDGPYAKLDRAREHLDTLRRELDRAEAVNAYRAVEEFNSEERRHIWRLKVDSTVVERLSVVAGDVVHNLRSSLDHLVWQLILKAGRQPTKTAEFPIYLSKSPPPRECFDKAGRRKIHDVPDEAKDIIESVQPYHSAKPSESDLWLLNELDNIDKHRTLIGIFAAARAVHIYGSATDIRGMTFTPRRCEDGDELLSINAGASGQLQEDDKPTFSFVPVLDIPVDRFRPWYIWPTLEHIYETIRNDVIDRFVDIFPLS